MSSNIPGIKYILSNFFLFFFFVIYLSNFLLYIKHILVCSVFYSSLFTNSNWFAFQENRIDETPVTTSPSEMMDEINLNGTTSGGNSSSDDEVVVGEDEELAESKGSFNGTSSSKMDLANGFNSPMNGAMNTQNEKPSASGDLSFFQFETPANEDLFGDRPLPEWMGWGESADLQVGGSSLNPFEDDDGNTGVTDSIPSVELVPSVNTSLPGQPVLRNGSPTAISSEGPVGPGSSQRGDVVPSLFEEDVEFVGVELEGTEKAMEQALKEGIVGEAGPLKRNMIAKVPEKENSDDGGAGMKEFNDANYWRVDTEVAVLE